MTVALTVRRLSETDTLGAFESQVEQLDEYIRKYARQSQRRGWNATWLALDGDWIAGFATIVSGSVESSILRGVIPKLPQYPAPVLKVARMATDHRFTGRRVGSTLMAAVYQAAIEQAARSGCVGVFTDAKPAVEGKPRAVDFYAKLGFTIVEEAASPDKTTGMFMPLATVEARLAELRL
jgi:GNAT superfamily N-acetyltransferase